MRRGEHGIQCNICGETLHDNEICDDAECPIGTSGAGAADRELHGSSMPPDGTGAAEPVAWRWQHVNDRREPRPWTYQGEPIRNHNEYLIVEPLYAAPPARGGREAITDLLEKRAAGYEARATSIFNGRIIADELRGNIRAILSLPSAPVSDAAFHAFRKNPYSTVDECALCHKSERDHAAPVSGRDAVVEDVLRSVWADIEFAATNAATDDYHGDISDATVAKLSAIFFPEKRP